jgi:hypothetical protein
LRHQMRENFFGASRVSGAFSVHSVKYVGHEDRRV